MDQGIAGKSGLVPSGIERLFMYGNEPYSVYNPERQTRRGGTFSDNLRALPFWEIPPAAKQSGISLNY